MTNLHESDVWNGGDALIERGAELPTDEASAFSATSPILVRSEGRHVPLYVRATAPTTGRDLGIILVSHDGGTGNYLSSLRGLGPLVDVRPPEGKYLAWAKPCVEQQRDYRTVPVGGHCRPQALDLLNADRPGGGRWPRESCVAAHANMDCLGSGHGAPRSRVPPTARPGLGLPA